MSNSKIVKNWFNNKRNRLFENTGSVLYIIYNAVEYPIRKLAGGGIWPTKSFIIWLLLNNLLFLVKPKKILELGSGRSTNYLSEYANKNNAEYNSIEHNLFYYSKIKMGLKLSLLNPEYIKYVPLHKSWYKIKRLDKFLSNYSKIEFLYLDGPGTTKDDRRDPEEFYEYFLKKFDNIKMILIDDIHWDYGEKAAQRLSKALNLKRYDVEYKQGKNDVVMSLLFSKDEVSKISRLPSYLKELLNVN